jgi:hypothetical protein
MVVAEVSKETGLVLGLFVADVGETELSLFVDPSISPYDIQSGDKYDFVTGTFSLSDAREAERQAELDALLIEAWEPAP